MQSGRVSGKKVRVVESKERLMAYNWQRGRRTCEAVKRKRAEERK